MHDSTSTTQAPEWTISNVNTDENSSVCISTYKVFSAMLHLRVLRDNKFMFIIHDFQLPIIIYKRCLTLAHPNVKDLLLKSIPVRFFYPK